MNFHPAKKISALLFITIFLAGVTIALGANQAFAQAEDSGVSNQEGLLHSVEEAHKSLLSDIESLKKRQEEAQALEKRTNLEIENFKLKRASYSSPLLLTEPDSEELRKAKAGVFNDIKEIEQQLEYLNKLLEQANGAGSKSLERSALYTEQIARLKDEKEKRPEAASLLEKLRQMVKALSTERDLLNSLQKIYTAQIKQFDDLRDSYQGLYEKLGIALETQRKSELTRKSSSALIDFSWRRVSLELGRAAGKVGSVLSVQFWKEEGRSVSQFNLYLLGSFLVLLALAQLLFSRLCRYCATLRQKPSLQPYPSLLLAIELFRRSVRLFGTAVFLHVYGEVRQLYSLLPVYPFVLDVLLVWLATTWVLDFLKIFYESKGLDLKGVLFRKLRSAVYLIRIFVITYAAVDWALDNGSWFLSLWRILFSALLFLYAFKIAKIIRACEVPETPGGWFSAVVCRKILIGVMYLIAMGGLFIELAGYGNFSLFWLASWGRVLVLFLWGGLLFFILQELDRGQVSMEEPGDQPKTSNPLRWLLIRVGQLSWVLAMSVGLLVAWGAGGSLIIHFFNFLNRPFQVGSLQLSLQSVGYALLVLLITHAVASLWRPFFHDRVLDRSGMEKGVQASITTISIYIIWFLGILICLNTIGVSTTSLAVLFGALGIGLGFGLQNIFSNFVSGLILLFERPVQVGDAVQIDGTWGHIQNINVRATVVQTYDNASLIIPNSDFISKQVTNWSFKDPRVRISVEVGVAYGSDVRLVNQTLLEVARNHPRVMETPKPDVLFTDFGDSALMFRLRAWTHLNYMLSAATEIRFEVDRLFRERDIEIPFPQRDIHVRSMVERPESAKESDEEE